ncbi:MAG: cation transporter [Spirochaetales bacterium]|nr:cation transporter [Spirochaetales bacterium]
MDKTQRLWQAALILSIITVVYNVFEGIFSTFFGYSDEALALFGFGVDSFVEVISGLGVGHMVIRLMRKGPAERDRFETLALRITGISFYILAAGLVAGAVLSIIFNRKPDTTLPGLIISLISIATMWALMLFKLHVGKKLNSDPIIADAHCTRTCLYLSFILLGSSLVYLIFKLPYVDSIGSLGIAVFAFLEGKEAMEKAANKSLSCSCGHDGKEEAC